MISRLHRHTLLLIAFSCGLMACSANNSSPTTDSVTLKLLAHESFTPSEGIFDAFTLETGIAVEILYSADAGTLVAKAALTAGSPEGDVLWGVDNTLLSRALEAEMFTPYVSPNTAFIDDSLLKLVPNGEATPVDTGDVCINYDKAWFAQRKISPPLTLEALASATYRSLLVAPSALTSSPGLAFLLASIAEFGEDWQDYWARLRENRILIVDSWSEAYYTHFTAASDGERPLVVSYASSPPAEVIYSDPKLTEAPTAVAALTCFRQIEFAGILRGTKYEAQAQLLMDYLISTPFQSDLPLTQFVYPVNREVVLPNEFVRYSMRPENPLTIPPDEIAARRNEWLEQYTQIVLR